MQVEWGKAKTALVFLIAVCGSLAMREPLSIPHGVLVKEFAGILWFAYTTVFAYLLTNPKPKNKTVSLAEMPTIEEQK